MNRRLLLGAAPAAAVFAMMGGQSMAQSAPLNSTQGMTPAQREAIEHGIAVACQARLPDREHMARVIRGQAQPANRKWLDDLQSRFGANIEYVAQGLELANA